MIIDDCVYHVFGELEKDRPEWTKNDHFKMMKRAIREYGSVQNCWEYFLTATKHVQLPENTEYRPGDILVHGLDVCPGVVQDDRTVMIRTLYGREVIDMSRSETITHWRKE